MASFSFNLFIEGLPEGTEHVRVGASLDTGTDYWPQEFNAIDGVADAYYQLSDLDGREQIWFSIICERSVDPVVLGRYLIGPYVVSEINSVVEA